jgi:hypothetical protein|tara:strand:- start:6874 stop:7044 length:171 start_codon:yes stop_codon:yes gene_type:complete
MKMGIYKLTPILTSDDPTYAVEISLVYPLNILGMVNQYNGIPLETVGNQVGCPAKT